MLDNLPSLFLLRRANLACLEGHKFDQRWDQYRQEIARLPTTSSYTR